MLEYFRKVKELEIANLKKRTDLNPVKRQRISLSQSLNKVDKISIIAEYKRASPSKGDINLEAKPEEAAISYLQAGAQAISVLTETTKFKGELNYLDLMSKSISNSLPLLRKDFILDSLQIKNTAETLASAFLLIVKLTPDKLLLEELITLGKDYNLEAVVEIFDIQELELARAAGASIIQVNARDLNSFTIDKQLHYNLIKEKLPKETWIAASDIKTPEELKHLFEVGYNSALIGTSLMQQKNLTAALKNLRTI